MGAAERAPTGTPALGLDGHLCFALYTASRAMTSLYRLLLDDLGLTYPQYLVLLAFTEDESQTVKQLGEALELDYGTLSPLLKRMEAGNVIIRRRRSEDERSVEVTLTKRGTALRARAEAVAPDVVAASGLNPTELRSLLDALHDVRDSVAAAVDGHTRR